MHRYRISKYNPQYRNKQGYYQKNEWTSYWDIGESYHGRVFRKEEYLRVEMLYCNVLLSILKNARITELIVKNLEMNYSVWEIKQMLQARGLKLSIPEENVINALHNGKKISIDKLPLYLKLVLRECFWCRFLDENFQYLIEVGYDFYIYLYCNGVFEKMLDDYKEEGIFIEKISD